jgi:hypothetical protein
VATAYQLLNGEGDVDTAHRLLVRAIDALADPHDAHNKTLHEALYSLIMASFFGGRAELWESVHAAVTWRFTLTSAKNVVLVHGGFVDGSGWRGPVH